MPPAAGDRPYRCVVDGCSKAFRQLSSLQQHLKGHNVPLPKSYSFTRSLSSSYSSVLPNAATADNHRKVVNTFTGCVLSC